MARPRGKPATKFARQLAKSGMTDTALAKKLDCTVAYVGMLRRGAATPGLARALRIELLVGFPVGAW